MVNALRASGKTAVLVSEELDDAVIIEDGYKGRYCVVFDPLDGSSNIDAGVNIGTIFGVYAVVCYFVSRSLSIHNLTVFLKATGFYRHRCRRPSSWKRNGCRRLYYVLFCYSFHPSLCFNETCRYGSSANLVLSTGSGVNGYTLDASLGEFILTHPNVNILSSSAHLNRTHLCIDHHSLPWQNLLVQRRKCHVLPPPCHGLSQVHQISS